MQDVVIIGAGGFGREVLDVFDAVNSIKPVFRVLGFIVDSRFGKAGAYVNDKPILGGLDWIGEHRFDVKAICGVGAPEQRFHLIKRAQLLKVDFCSVIHPNAILTPRVTIGKGVVITSGCIFTNNIRVGNHVQVNLGCTVGHDVVIDDFATISPGSHVSGKVIIRQGAFIGTGTNIIEKIAVGAWSTIGAGSTVISDIPENTVAVGLPAKIIKKKTTNWHLQKK